MTDYNWGQGGQGAVGGAMTGASLGSVAGPWGTAIGGGLGAVVGGLGGLFGGTNDYEARLKKLAEGYGNRQAPQAGQSARGEYSDFRQNQAGLISQLEAMARGEGPSAAAIQMREAMDRAAGAQASAAAGAGGRGVNAGAAFRNASNNTAAIQAQGARDTATLRAQEQLNATGLLGQTIGQGRAADENMNQFNAGQQNNMSQFNVDAQLRAMGINTQAQLQALAQAAGQAGPGFGSQMLGAGASAVGPALQYASAQRQMASNNAAGQRQQQNQQSQNDQANQAQLNSYNQYMGNTQPQPGSFNGLPSQQNQQPQFPLWMRNLMNPMGV